MQKKFFYIIICFTLIFTASCSKHQEYPIVPSLEYFSFMQENQICKLELNFTDGDGDIGLGDWQTYPPFDTSSKFRNNLFITVFQKINGNIIPYYSNESQTDTLQFNYRIKTIEPIGGQDYLKGKLVVEITDPFWLSKANLKSDTVVFHCVLYDRKLHASNVVITPDLVVQRY